MPSRWLALASAAFVVCVILVVAGPAAAVGGGGAARACGMPCGTEQSSLHGSAHSQPLSCIRDAGCGGGGALALGLDGALAVLFAGAAVIGGAVAAWRSRRVWSRVPVGVLLTSGRFRPPRILLGV